MEFDVIGIDEGQFFEDVSFKMLLIVYRLTNFQRLQQTMEKS